MHLKSGFIREVVLGESGFIREVVLGESGFIREVVLGDSDFIREVVLGESGFIRGRLLFQVLKSFLYCYFQFSDISGYCHKNPIVFHPYK